MPKSRIEKSESNSAHLARRNSLGGQSQVPISQKFRVENSEFDIENFESNFFKTFSLKLKIFRYAFQNSLKKMNRF